MSDSKFKKVGHLPDPGTEPASVTRNREIRKRLAAAEPVQADFVRVEQVHEINEEGVVDSEVKTIERLIHAVPKAPALNSLEAMSEMIKLQDQSIPVEVKGDFGKIHFRAVNVSYNEYGIAFIIHKDHMSYEPNINTELNITINKDEEHNVIYAGGFFTFKNIPFNFLSFIKITA